MHAVITGDVVDSRLVEPGVWLQPLKALLNQFGKSPGGWEIYRGDSFQLLLDDPREALKAAVRIKANIKHQKALDVRMGIGIGTVDHRAERITESNGQAFIHSGDVFERLKEEKCNLALRSPWEALDQELNLALRLGLVAMDQWTPASAKLVGLRLEHSDMKQADLAKALGIAQSSVSERQTRAHFDEIVLLEARFRQRIDEALKTVSGPSLKNKSN